jgi:hypothetical protein
MTDYGLDVFDAAGGSVFNANYSTWLIVATGNIAVGGADVTFDKSLHPTFNNFTVCIGTRLPRIRNSTEKGLTWAGNANSLDILNPGISQEWYYVVLGS